MSYVPMGINGFWEIVQWAGVTDGRADAIDVMAGVCGWGVAEVFRFEAVSSVAPIERLGDWRLVVLVASCGLMGFADVL